MDIILLVLHVCVALAMITLILLQKGKGASEGATFGAGGGGAGSVFGASGSSNFLSKTTAILATVFFLNSLALAYLAANRDQPASVLESLTQSGEQLESVAPANPVDDLLPPVDDVVQPGAETDVPPPAE